MKKSILIFLMMFFLISFNSVCFGDDLNNFLNVVKPNFDRLLSDINELRKNNNETVLSILEKATGNTSYKDGSDQRKAADFYAVGMDTVLAEERGVEPLNPWLDKINGINNIETLLPVLEEMHVAGFTGFYGLGVFGDLKNSSMNALYLAPNALGLPNRDYYTKDDSSSVATREKYVFMLVFPGIRNHFAGCEK